MSGTDNRHAVRDTEGEPASSVSLRSLEMVYERGSRIPAHGHQWAQLLYVSEGVLEVELERSTWVLPDRRALWLPPRTVHGFRVEVCSRLSTLYLPPEAVPDEAAGAAVLLDVSALFRQLILFSVEHAPFENRPPGSSIVELILWWVGQAIPLEPVLLPRDQRALRLARLLLRRPTAGSLAQACTEAGASRRTLERLFQAETGLTLGAWRRRVVSWQATRRLRDGETVQQVASAVGYGSTAAFVRAFKSEFGSTPGAWRASEGGQVGSDEPTIRGAPHD